MRIVLALKPYAVEVYSHENNAYTLISVEQGTQIDGESPSDYEKRMIFICKNLCMEIKASSFFKDAARALKGIDVVLSAPWCTYDVVQVEKDLGKKTKITDAVLKSMFVKKDEKELRVVESYTSNILLNGYKVKSIEEQMAQIVQFQYVHVYAKESFVTPLIKTIETIFHTHEVSFMSIYGLVNAMSQDAEHKPELHVVVEEESVDISYIFDGLRIVNVFVPQSYAHIERDIAHALSAHTSVVQEILLSRGQASQQTDIISVDKNAKKLWPDLDAEVKKTIDKNLAEGIEKIVQHIRNCIDALDVEYLKSSTSVYVYCTNKNLVTSYGTELARTISTDPYLSMKIHPELGSDAVRPIFS